VLNGWENAVTSTRMLMCCEILKIVVTM